VHGVRGVAQHYAWGDLRAIPELLGIPADGRPWAEWWLGTHPAAPASLDDGTPLSVVSGRLPYLLKLLAAAEALSLQTHPDAATAAAGFARENAAGIALDDRARIYRDPNAKPEILIALTEFDALCGFRTAEDTAALLRSMGADDLAERLLADGLDTTVAAVYHRAVNTDAVVHACREHRSPEAELVAQLADQYPGDPSVVATLFLHRVRLAPGEAIYLRPGNLHAYLHGLGVEVMGASDNVVRGGLTVKHVDVDELMRVLSFEPLREPVVRAESLGGGMWHYPTPGAPFAVVRIDVKDRQLYTAEGRDLLLCTSGDARTVHRGETVFLEAGEQVVLHGPSTLFAVTAP
jgi:mannose-6-phosphate isomerase